MKRKLLIAGAVLLLAGTGFAGGVVGAQFTAGVFNVVGDVHTYNNDPFSDFNTAIAEEPTVRLDGSAGALDLGAGDSTAPTWQIAYDSANRATIAAGDSLALEGATADAFETIITTEDATADVTYEFQDDLADTYEILAIPDADVTGGHFIWPPSATADTVTTAGDNVLTCERIYLPMYLTVANVYTKGVVGADSGSDDTLAVAIYEDADAGTQLTEAQSADQSATADLTLDVTDVTLGPGMYRLCGCSQDVSGIAFHAETFDDEAIDSINNDTVVFGTAANACVAGDPPATTGALTSADDTRPVFKLAG